MSDKLVTIKIYNNPVIAGVAKTKLDSEGIFSFIADQEIANIPDLGTIFNQVRLQVRELDAQRAKTILKLI